MVKTERKEMECPFCGKGRIELLATPEYYSYKTSHAAHQTKRIPLYHPEDIEVKSSCQECGKGRNDIKKSLNGGEKKEIPHDEAVRRLKAAGLPTKIEFKA